MQGKRAPRCAFPMHPPPDPLEPLLDRWGHPPPVSPLAAEVRRRLAPPAARSRPPDSIFLRPAFAALFIAACMLLGLFLAEVRVSRLHDDRDRALLQSYRRLIDPLLSAAPTAPPEARS